MEQTIFLKKEQHQVTTDLHFDFCGISKTLPFHSFGPAIRQNYILHVVMEGRGTYQVKNQQYHLKKGDLFLIRPGDSTFYLADGEEPWMYGWLSFSGEAAETILQHTHFRDANYTMVSSNIQNYIDTILACLSFSEETMENELRLNALTHQFLADLIADGGKSHLGETKKYSPLAVETVAYIEAHYSEQLTVEAIARQLSVNRSHLSRVFRNHMDSSIKDYILGVRINRAAFLLSMTEETVETIAGQVGFNSLVVFSRMFKKMTGETATAYRKRMKREESQTISLDGWKQQLEKQAVVRRAT
ncbi:AraC family transcriptional regulator (plasmid) [Enterococcus gilvus]|jgi:AraC family transcriptional regulator, arabinose operon regulatory protein|uniref:AraC family transcriptional regulator n=1 Tax=Enterococcus gilvus TaxID=160453 RepID=UPI000DF5E52B|nr:AraC family transcriptional regulator [Enterococcus gilvus]AXG39868.1 AraC family transcriptional regulator [Enterococcus gilvus]